MKKQLVRFRFFYDVTFKVLGRELHLQKAVN